MSARDEIIAFLGLPAGATFSEIEHAYIVRCNAAGERLVAGDESARVELAALKETFGRLAGRTDVQGGNLATGGAVGSTVVPEEKHLRAPAWWECYLGLLAALASVVALAALVASLSQVYHEGGFLRPFALIGSAALLSIFATMLSEAELRQGRRMRILRNRGLDSEGASPPLRFHVARVAIFLSRGVRWLTVPALIITAFLNFASLSGRWSIR
jgi:hypothetical protein